MNINYHYEHDDDDDDSIDIVGELSRKHSSLRFSDLCHLAKRKKNIGKVSKHFLFFSLLHLSYLFIY